MTDSGIASKATSSPSSAARSDHSAMTVPSEMRGGSGDSLRRQAVGRHTGSVSVTNSSHQFGKIDIQSVICIISSRRWSMLWRLSVFASILFSILLYWGCGFQISIDDYYT